MVDATTSTTGTSGTTKTPSGTSAQQGLNNDYDQFLKLLTTELTNQDPTTPLDTNQITQQIATLSQVQQTINTNTKLDTLIASYNAAASNQAVSYIGKQVDATGNQINLSGGAGAVVYSLPSNATGATVTIKDSTGAVVFTSSGTATPGRNQLLWNGKNSTTKAASPDGIYTFSIAATDSKSAAVTATPFTSGVVTSVNTQGGTNTLSLGAITVPLNTIQSVYTAGTNPSA